MHEPDAIPKHLMPGAPTVDHPASGPPPGGPPEGVQVALASGSGPRLSGEIQALLRKRLRVLFLILAAVLGLGVPLYLMNILLMRGPLPRVSWAGFALCGAGSLLAAALAVLLTSRRPLSLGQLRAAELVLVGLTAFLCVWKQSSYLEGGLFFRQFRGPDRLPVLAAYHSLPWFALLAAYGLFVPNTWRRCAVVVGVIALCPFAVLAADTRQPGWGITGRALLPYLTVLGLWMTFGAVLAIFGSHHITALRREASAARRLGQYRLKKRLGAGGMGEVYLAEHVLLRRPCAIKLIRPERAGDPQTLRRFEREVQATAALTHPNTVEVFDYGHAEDGTFYYAMEYLPGLSLEDLVRRDGPLPPGRVVHLMRQVCGALREAHAAGLIHRDIKPGNILVCERGGVPDVAKLLDFGLVRAPGWDPEGGKLTQEGVIAGTPAYMSPDQAGAADRVDARSDLYSLGAVTYFLLTGQPPFVRESALHTLAAHLREEVVAPDRHQAEVPADLQAVVLRCLEKDPARRFPDAAALEQALAACQCAGGWTREQAAAWWREHAAREADRPSEATPTAGPAPPGAAGPRGGPERT
jgi:serine/threonine-protein kinase